MHLSPPSHIQMDRHRGEQRRKALRSRDSHDETLYRDYHVEIRHISAPSGRPSAPRRRAERDSPSRRFVVNVQPQRHEGTRKVLPARERYVTVKLPLLGQPLWDDSNVGLGFEYRIKRRHLVYFLPNTASAIADDILDLQGFFPVVCDQHIGQTREACVFVFDFIHETVNARWDTVPADPFEEMVRRITRARDRKCAVMDAGSRLLSLCSVLHRETGMGCGEQLLDEIGRFAEQLYNVWGSYLSPGHRISLFLALLEVYVPNSRGLYRSMQNIWRGLGFREKQRVAERTYEMTRINDKSAWEEWVLLTHLDNESVSVRDGAGVERRRI